MNAKPLTARFLLGAVAVALGLTAAACSSSTDTADTKSTTTGTAAGATGLLDTFTAAAQQGGFEVTADESACMSDFLATRPELAAKTKPANRQDSKDANEMMVSCLGPQRTGEFVIGNAPADSKACVGAFFTTFDQATLVEELTAAGDTPPGTIDAAVQAACPPPAAGAGAAPDVSVAPATTP